ncbi:MAG: hypothetical protein IJO32_07425 [Bacilli bacterium]|nr:hypothetical protein [Bacilli bacterium]
MKKSYIIIFGSLSIYILLVLILFGKNEKKIIPEEYILIGNDIKLSTYDNKWDTIDNEVFNIKKFYVYDDNEYKGKFEVKYHNDRVYLFDEKRNSIKLNGNFTAVSSKNIKIKEFKIDSITDINNSIIKKIEEELKIKIDSLEQLSLNQKVVLDFDNDGENEELYLLSNMFNMNNGKIKKGFSLVWYVNNNKIQKLIDLVINEKKRLDSYSYSISGIIDYNNDKEYELIISKEMFRPNYSCALVYKLNNNKFIEEKSC